MILFTPGVFVMQLQTFCHVVVNIIATALLKVGIAPRLGINHNVIKLQLITRSVGSRFMNQRFKKPYWLFMKMSGRGYVLQNKGPFLKQIPRFSSDFIRK